MLARHRTYEYTLLCSALEVINTAHRRVREARLEAQVIAL
jgi:hypothetical protein